MKRLVLMLVVVVLCWGRQAVAVVGTANEIEVDQGGRIGLVDPVIVAKGGTGVASLTDRAVIVGRGTSAVEFATTGTAGRVLIDNGAGSNPSFGAVDLADTDAATGTLPVARGGTNLTTASDDNVMVGNGTTWQAKALTDCDGASSAVTYDTTTNTFGCNSITAGLAPLLSGSTLGDVAGGQTTFFAPGTVDPTEARAQQIAPEGFSLDDLRCVSSAAPGTSNTFVVTMGDGACTGALSDSATQTCTISGTGRTCTDGGAAEAVTAGECWRWKVVSLDGDTATAVISCTARRTA